MRNAILILVGLVCFYGYAQPGPKKAKPNAPSALSYNSPNVFTVGTPIPTLLPTVSGSVSLYAVSPTLPAGLTLNSSTGAISGTPASVAPTAIYTVTASNQWGNKTFGISIKVNASVSAPSALTYYSPNVFTVGSPIPTLTPSVSGTVTSYSVSPQLPSGLSINTTTGLITGTPNTATSLNTYMVTASSAAGSTSFGVKITVNAPLSAPSSLSYTTPNVFTKGVAISNLTPTVGGTITSYSVSPVLPSGLSLNTTTGVISGTPGVAASAATYTVTGSNAAGSRTFGVSIAVNNPVSAPSGLSYNSPNVFVAGTAIASLTPTFSGTATSFSVSPSLPSGLSLSTSTGVVSGTPAAATSIGTYTVTAANSAGSTSYGLVITVNPVVVSNPAPSSPSPVTTVVYSPTSSAIANPERGFYKHTETHSTGYYPLSQSTLTGYRTNSNITLILRVFYLEDFVNGSISSTYLTNMQSDFAKLRAAGIKCIVRFAYADHNDPGVPHDAPKSIILSHINQLTPILQQNSDVIAVMQAGFIGSWGEWYYTDHFGMSPTATDYANRKDVVNALLAAVPDKMVQMRTPKLKQNTYTTTTALTEAQAFSTANIARIGHHNDCFLASSSDYGTYSNITAEYPYLEQETKFTPMGGETCAVNAPRSECTTAMNEMAKFHWSYMNLDYHESVIAGFQSNNCFSDMQNRMGYRFELIDATLPTTATLGGTMAVTMKVKNIGFATPFNARVPYIVLRNTVTGTEYKVAMAANPRYWSPATTTTVTETLTLPSNIVSGSYKMYLSLPDTDTELSTRPEYAIRFANNNTWEAASGYNFLNHTINVTNTSARIADGRIIDEQKALTLYPVPANNALTVEMSGLENHKITVYNSIGQTMSATITMLSADQAEINTQNLSNGVYFVNLGSGGETKRFIVSH